MNSERSFSSTQMTQSRKGFEIAVLSSASLRLCVRFISDLMLGQFFPQRRAGFDAAVEIGQAKLFVGAVRVVVVQAPAQEQRVDASSLRKSLTIGIEPPSRMNTGALPKPCSIAFAAAATYGLSSGTTTPGAPPNSKISIVIPLGQSSHSLRFERLGDFRRVLIRHQAKAEFRARPRGQNRLRSFALIAACEAVDIERRPGPSAFQAS